MGTETLIKKISQKQIWDTEPVFCFTSDIDWASEIVMDKYFQIINPFKLKPTLFLTHESTITDCYSHHIDKGLHPNFLNESSHGNNFKDVINHIRKIDKNTKAVRSHRAFEVTDTSHLLYENDFRYSSNCITVLQPEIKPVLHESKLINFPVFFEDGTHLYNELNLDFTKYIDSFKTPGIKIISFHPMHLVLNSPSLQYMRDIKNFFTREQYNNISIENITNIENRGIGIRNTILDIIDFVYNNNYKIMSLNQLYNQTIQ